MKILYRDLNLKAGSLAIIEQANAIIDEYTRQGFQLTLRQLYYQFVARGIIKNKQTEYKRLGSIVSDGRLAGLISWHAIEDRTRNIRKNAHWDTPKDIIAAARNSYAIDMWENQPTHVEVWIEKDALIGVIEAVCRDNDVTYFACRGYSSQSEQWNAGQRFSHEGKPTIILHLGDHDPSGIDMTRDNEERLSMFAGEPVEMRRLALNWDQVQEHNPPPNPTKMTDSRAESYVREFGKECWELDALEPRLIAELIQREIDDIRDPDLWEAAEARLAADQSKLEELLEGL